MRRFTSAHALSIVAIFVALGGTSYAAAKITSAQVRDNSLTGRDVKDRSLSGRDVRDRSLKAADFATGQLPAGPRGAQGARGPAGPTGPTGRPGKETRSGARHARSFGEVQLPSVGSATPILSAQLGDGPWVVTGTATLDNDAAVVARVACQLFVNGTISDMPTIRLAADGSPGESVPVSLTGVVDARSNPAAQLRCQLENTGDLDVEAVNATVTATAVETISRTTG